MFYVDPFVCDRMSVERIYIVFPSFLCLVGCKMFHQHIVHMGLRFVNIMQLFVGVGDGWGLGVRPNLWIVGGFPSL